MIRDIAFYANLSWRLALVALAGVIFIGLGITDNGLSNVFAYSPWRRFG